MNAGLLKVIVSLSLGLVLILFSAECAAPQVDEIGRYPSRPITLIFPYPAGVSAEIAYRLLCKEAEKYLGQPIVIVNKPGAGGTLGMAALAAAKPDGYTIGQGGGGSATFVTPFMEKLPYDPIRDFRSIIGFSATNYGIIVRADSTFKGFQDLISYARKNPRKLTYSTAGAITMHGLILGQIAKREKVEITHIPSKGTNESEMALMGGHIHFAAGDFTHSLIEAGETRLIVLFREEHSEEYPDVPILKDLGYDYPFAIYRTIAAPKGVTDGVIKKLEDAFTKATKQPDFIKGLKELRTPFLYRNSKDTDAYLLHNYEFFGKAIRDAGLAK